MNNTGNDGRHLAAYLFSRRNRHIPLLVTAFCVLAAMSVLSAQDKTEDKFSPFVDAKGNIALPKDFETQFVHLGTIAVATEENKAVDQMHSTYTRGKDIEAFKKTGQFADGAVLVKAVRGTKHETLTTGETSYAKDIKVWFVMVKDSKGRFKDNDLWGDGWGWALFKGDDPATQVATDYSSDCRECHVPAKKSDWVFTQCYPLLQKARRKTSPSK